MSMVMHVLIEFIMYYVSSCRHILLYNDTVELSLSTDLDKII